MIITNINGTTDNICNCGSWLDHWLRFSGQLLPPHCPEARCIDKPTVGAHIQLGGLMGGNEWYIIPLCQSHNRSVARLEVSNSIRLVSANVGQTCGRLPPR